MAKGYKIRTGITFSRMGGKVPRPVRFATTRPVSRKSQAVRRGLTGLSPITNTVWSAYKAGKFLDRKWRR